jgi:Ras-related protein Rab-18
VCRDTAGQERFRTLTSAYYRGAHGIILVYDIASRESFENLTHWLKEIDIYSTNEDAIKLLIGNKIDKDGSARQVTKREGSAFAREHGMLFIEASAKTQEGVMQAFQELLAKILDVPALLSGSDAFGGASSASASNANLTADNSGDAAAAPCGC